MRKSTWLLAGAVALALPAVGFGQTPRTRGGALGRPQSGSVLVLRPTAAALQSDSWRAGQLDQASEVVSRRLRLSGIASPAVAVDRAAHTLTIRVPAGRSPRGLASLLTRPGVLEFRSIKQLDREWSHRPEMVNGRECAFEVIVAADGRPVPPRAMAAVLARPPAFTGADLQPNAHAAPSLSGIYFEFKAAQKARFERFTKEHIGRTLAIFVDRRLVCAPTINEAIPGKGTIEGRFTPEEARDLAIQLNSGALPEPLEVVGRPSIRPAPRK